MQTAFFKPGALGILLCSRKVPESVPLQALRAIKCGKGLKFNFATLAVEKNGRLKRVALGLYFITNVFWALHAINQSECGAGCRRKEGFLAEVTDR